jgi:hypothetical protein
MTVKEMANMTEKMAVLENKQINEDHDSDDKEEKEQIIKKERNYKN